MIRIRGACALAAIASLLAVRPASAADVGLVARDASDPFVARLVQELEQLGFTVARPLSKEASSDTAVLVVSETDDIELYAASDEGPRTRRTLRARRSDPLLVAEEVRALLLPLVRRATPPPAVVVAPAPAISPPPPDTVTKDDRDDRSRSFEVAAGVAALVGSGGPGLAIHAGVHAFPSALRWRSGAIGFGAGALFAAAPETVNAIEGSTAIRSVLFGPEVLARLELGARIIGDVAIGASAAYVRFAGDAVAPFTARDESAWTFAPSLRLRPGYRLGRATLFVDGRIGVATPAIAVRFAGQPVIDWGRPWGAIGGGLALAF